MTLEALLEKTDASSDFLRDLIALALRQLMSHEVDNLCGAGHGKRSAERVNSRNGYRERVWQTRAGAIELAIPNLCKGSYFPSFLEARRTAEKALMAVIQEACILGVSTRSVDNLVKALGMTGISRSQVSRLCEDIDTRVKAFPTAPSRGCGPILWLGATYLKVRRNGRVVPVAVVVAIAVNEDGRREIVGIDVMPAETEIFWTEFLDSLTARGLGGVRLVVSDDHKGLKAAATRILGTTWQRCYVHSSAPSRPASTTRSAAP